MCECVVEGERVRKRDRERDGRLITSTSDTCKILISEKRKNIDWNFLLGSSLKLLYPSIWQRILGVLQSSMK